MPSTMSKTQGLKSLHYLHQRGPGNQVAAAGEGLRACGTSPLRGECSAASEKNEFMFAK